MVKKFFTTIFFIVGLVLEVYAVLFSISSYARDSILFKVPVIFTFFKNNIIEYNIFLSLLLGTFFIFLSFVIKGFKNFGIIRAEKRIKQYDTTFNFGDVFFLKLLIATILSLILLLIPHKYLLLQYITFLLMSICLVLLLNFKNLKVKIFKTLEINNKDIRNILLLCSLYFVFHISFLANPSQFHWGDEGAFFEVTSGLIKDNFKFRSFFDQYGVYGKNPNSSHIEQALMMLPFNVSIFSFRLTSLVSIMMTIIPMYLTAKLMFSRNVAIITSLLICFSHYFYGFNYLSYNNILGLPIASFAALLFFITVVKKSFNASILCGIFSGLCWYQYGIATLCVFAFFPSMLFVTSNVNYKNSFKRLFIIYFIMFLFIIPMYFRSSVEQNIYYFMQNANGDNNNNIMEVLHRLRVGFFYSLTIGVSSHWIFRTSIDIFSEIFLFLGFFVSIKNSFFFKKYRLFLIFTMVLWLELALLNHYSDFPNTRLMYILIYWLVIISIGIDTFVKFVFKNKKIGFSIILTLVAFMNYEYAFSFPFKYVYEGKYETSVVEVAKENTNVGSIYMVSPEHYGDNHQKTFFDGYLVMQNIIIVQRNKLEKLPEKLHKSDLILVNVENKGDIKEIVKRYEMQAPYVLYRKNLNDRAQVYMIGLKETLERYLNETSPDKIIVNRII